MWDSEARIPCQAATPPLLLQSNWLFAKYHEQPTPSIPYLIHSKKGLDLHGKDLLYLQWVVKWRSGMEHTSKLSFTPEYQYVRTHTFSGGVACWCHSPQCGIIIRQNQHLHHEWQSRCSPSSHQPNQCQYMDPQQDILACLPPSHTSSCRQVHSQNSLCSWLTARSTGALGSQCCPISAEDCGSSWCYDEWSRWKLTLLFYANSFLDCWYSGGMSPGGYGTKSISDYHCHSWKFQWPLSTSTLHHGNNTNHNLCHPFETLTSWFQELYQSYQMTALKWHHWAILAGLGTIRALWLYHCRTPASFPLIYFGSQCEVVYCGGRGRGIGFLLLHYPDSCRLSKIQRRYPSWNKLPAMIIAQFNITS